MYKIYRILFCVASWQCLYKNVSTFVFVFFSFFLGKDAEPYVFILGLQKYLLYAASGKVIHFWSYS